VTLNRETRQYHVLNAAAAIIFQSATGDNTIEDIAEIISEVFGIDIGQALSDARETVEGMEKLGLISAS
jgi:2C-methyl-D-erythritol 2,4-cyclodiphosphate synthase